MSTGSDLQIPESDFGIHGVRNHIRHALAFLVTWWFFAKVVPVFTTVHANLGLTASVLTTLAVFLSTLAVLYGGWLLPVLLCGHFALGRAVQRIGGIQWSRRWSHLVEALLCSAVFIGMLAFGRMIINLAAN